MADKDEKSKLYEIRNSGIHDRGLFSSKRIPEGSLIVEYIGEKIGKTESERRGLERMEEARQDGGGFVYVFELNERYDIDGNVSENDARLINHSCEPNCEARVIKDHIWIVALDEISPGVELSYDYGYNLEHFFEHPCCCGSNICVGYIVRADKRRKLKRILKRRRRFERRSG